MMSHSFEELGTERESKRRRRGKNKEMDPRSLAPSSLNRTTFEAKYPHIRLELMKEKIGKFSCSEIMDVKVLRYLMQYIYKTVHGNKDIWYAIDGQPENSEMASRPLHLTFFACLSKLSKAFLVLKNKRKSEKQEENEAKELEEEEVAPHLQIMESLHPQFPTDQVSTYSTEGTIFNHEVRSGKGIPNIMVKAFCKTFLREKDLDPTSRMIVSYATEAKKLRTMIILDLKDDASVSQFYFPFYFLINLK
jgi:hypothetical protein